MRTALIQLNSSDDPAENIRTVCAAVREAARQGAKFVLTPEVTNCVSTSRERQNDVLRHEADDPTLAVLRHEAKTAGIWCLIGSLALKTDDPDGRFANRSFLITPEGEIKARYDKIHMFDVTVSETESYRESAGYRPGEQAVLVETDFATIGMTICYDVRFPHLYRALAKEGAQILTVPSAFSPVTGKAHWEDLLRARAIETGCFVLAPAQTGTHASSKGKPRQTYGHSLVVNPWGDIIADAGRTPGVLCMDIDVTEVETARRRIPSLRCANRFNDPV
jgi:predicted amidohydrolase